MTDSLVISLTVLSALGSGVVAGIFFAFSTFVMSALGRISSEQGISAMQSINVAVLNPAFFSVFFGTALTCFVLAIAAFYRWEDTAMLFVLGGSALYLVLTIGVTIVANVPLNDALAAVKPASAEGHALWTRYLTEWTAWNHVRTAAAIVAMALFIAAIYLQARGDGAP